MEKEKVDNPLDETPGKEGVEPGKPKEGTQPQYPEWLDKNFVVEGRTREQVIEEQAKGYPPAKKKMQELQAEVNRLKTGGAKTIRDALVEKKLQPSGGPELTRTPSPTLTTEQDAYIRDWHNRLISEDPIVAARAVQEATTGEIYRYDERRKKEDSVRDLNYQFEKMENKIDKEELEELMPHIIKIRDERPDLAKGPHAVEDVIDKARIRLVEEKMMMEEEESKLKTEKEQAGTTSPTKTQTSAEPTLEEMMSWSKEKLKAYIQSQNVEVKEIKPT